MKQNRVHIGVIVGLYWDILGLCRVYIGIIERNMQTTIMGYTGTTGASG